LVRVIPEEIIKLVDNPEILNTLVPEVVVLEKLDSTLTELHKEQTEVVMVFLVL
jgi:hypothetical protein